jgi:hypothetical protein
MGRRLWEGASVNQLVVQVLPSVVFLPVAWACLEVGFIGMPICERRRLR